MPEKEKRYSKWEYEEPAEPADPVDPADNPEGGDNPPAVTDDTEVEVEGEKVTLAELKKGFMRQSDYTKKTQELSEKEKSMQETAQARKVVENPDDYPEADVKAAEYFLKILKGKFGLMTREEYDKEVEKKEAVDNLNKEFKKAAREVAKMDGMPEFDEEKCMDHMRKSGIHNPMAAWKDLHDAEYRAYILKQGTGDKGYKTEKKGEKQEPVKKEFDNSREGQEAYLQEELNKMKEG